MRCPQKSRPASRLPARGGPRPWASWNALVHARPTCQMGGGWPRAVGNESKGGRWRRVGEAGTTRTGGGRVMRASAACRAGPSVRPAAFMSPRFLPASSFFRALLSDRGGGSSAQQHPSVQSGGWRGCRGGTAPVPPMDRVPPWQGGSVRVWWCLQFYGKPSQKCPPAIVL